MCHYLVLSDTVNRVISVGHPPPADVRPARRNKEASMVIECASRPERDACLSVDEKKKKKKHEKMQDAIVIHDS